MPEKDALDKAISSVMDVLGGNRTTKPPKDENPEEKLNPNSDYLFKPVPLAPYLGKPDEEKPETE